MAKPVIMVVEPNPTRRTYLEQTLPDEFETVETSGDRACLELLTLSRPCLVILSALAPKVNACSLLHLIRTQSDVPVIMLMPSDDVDDRVKALGMGADDCIPFLTNRRELAARIAAVLRRATVTPPPQPSI